MEITSLDSNLFFENNIRIIDDAFNFWISARDIGNYIGDTGLYKKTYKIDEYQKKSLKLKDSAGRMQEMLLLSEQGLYYYLMRPKKDKAKQFQSYIYDILRRRRKTLLTRVIEQIEEHLIFIEMMEYELSLNKTHPYVKLSLVEQQEFLNSRIQLHINKMSICECEEIIRLLILSNMGTINIKVIDGEPWFCLDDIAKHTNNMSRYRKIIPKINQNYIRSIGELTYVDELGLYTYLFESKNSETASFEKEICIQLQQLRLKRLDSKKIEEKYIEDKRLSLAKIYSVYRCNKHNNNQHLVETEGLMDEKMFIFPFIYKWTAEYLLIKKIKCDVYEFMVGKYYNLMIEKLAELWNNVENMKFKWFEILSSKS